MVSFTVSLPNQRFWIYDSCFLWTTKFYTLVLYKPCFFPLAFPPPPLFSLNIPKRATTATTITTTTTDKQINQKGSNKSKKIFWTKTSLTSWEWHNNTLQGRRDDVPKAHPVYLFIHVIEWVWTQVVSFLWFGVMYCLTVRWHNITRNPSKLPSEAFQSCRTKSGAESVDSKLCLLKSSP